MSADPNKKTARTFQCREVLWDAFQQMAQELECSVDYLINESMKQYARQRYGRAQAGRSGQTGSHTPPHHAPAARQSETETGALAVGRSAPAPHPASGGAGAAQAGPPTTSPPTGHPPPRVPPPSPPPGPLPPPTPPPLGGGVYVPPPPARGKPPTLPPPPTGRPTTALRHQSGATPVPAPGPGPMPRGAPPPLPPAGRVGSGMSPPPMAPGASSRAAALAGATPVYGQLSIVYAGERLQVTKDRFVIGRGKQSSDLTIKDPNVSRQHAMIEFVNGQYYMVDMGSTNGVEYAGHRISRRPIAEGDVFRICDHEVRFTYR